MYHLIKEDKDFKVLAIILLLIVIFWMDFILSDLLSSWISNNLVRNIFYQFVRVFITLGTLWGFLYLTLNKSISYYYVRDFPSKIGRWMFFGIVLPIIIILSYFTLGRLTFLGFNQFSNQIMLLKLIYTLILALSASITEEFLFRGFIYRLIEDQWNYKYSIVLPSIFFGLAHVQYLDLPNILLTGLSGTLAGTLFALILRKTKSIWNSIGIHFAWNLMLIGPLIKISVDNALLKEAILPFKINSSNILLTGTEFGVESSIVSIIILLLANIIVLKWFSSK